MADGERAGERASRLRATRLRVNPRNSRGTAMKYDISGTVMQTVGVDLAPGETVYSQTATMCWMSEAVLMATNTGGGLFAGLKRSLTGGSFFVTDYTAQGPRAPVAFAPPLPRT